MRSVERQEILQQLSLYSTEKANFNFFTVFSENTPRWTSLKDLFTYIDFRNLGKLKQLNQLSWVTIKVNFLVGIKAQPIGLSFRSVSEFSRMDFAWKQN